MSASFLDVMRTGLTPAYDRGMERLAVPLEPDGAGALRARYDFAAYRLRYGRAPDAPRYLLAPLRDTTEPLTVRVAFTRTGAPGAAEETVDVPFPAGWPGGDPVAVELPGRADEFTDALRVTALTPLPPAPAPAADWELTALLGTLARLLWTIGQDYQDLTRRLADVAGQRGALTAHGASLDLLGLDLGAPRFPPRPHSPDQDTLALYHLNDRPPPGSSQVTAVADATAPADPTRRGTVIGAARWGAAGRFSLAFGFTVPPAPDDTKGSAVSVPDRPDLAFAGDFTVEAVIRPDLAATATGAVLAKRAPLDTAAGRGWALTLGHYRGIARNPRFSLADGTTETELFADRDVGDGLFHHLAGTLSRTTAGAVARLYLDGVEVDRRRLDGLGPLTSTEPLVIGRGTEIDLALLGGVVTAQFTGRIEEVRVSRVARTSFDPVTGEGDAKYRNRLLIFQRWLVPTHDALETALNQATGPVAGQADAFLIDETPAPIATGSADLRVLPGPLTVGQSITADGDRLRTEAQAAGTVDDEPDFDPAWLCRHPDAPGLDFAGQDGNRLMQLTARRALDALLARLVGHGGTLSVVRAYDPAATDLHAVGRALELRYTDPAPGVAGLTLGELGAQAHAAGFGWVSCTADQVIRAVQPPGDAFAVTLSGGPGAAASGTVVSGPDVSGPDGTGRGVPDVTAGRTLTLGLDPPLNGPDPPPKGLAGASIRWSVTRGGPGDATVAPVTPAPAPGAAAPTGPQAVLQALAAGNVTVTADVTVGGHTRSGSRTVRIGLPDTALTPGTSISRDGLLGATEAQAAGTVTDDFDPSYLQLRTDDLTDRPVAAYGTDPNNRRMQPATSAALDRLLALTGPAGGILTVLAAYTPPVPGAPDPGLAGQGRALTLRHDNPAAPAQALSAPALAALAFAAGFDHIAVQAAAPPDTRATVRVAVGPGEQLAVTVAGPAAEVRVGESVAVAVAPRATPVAACLAPDGGRLYVAEHDSHRVAAFQLAAGLPTDLPVPAFAAAAPVAPFPGALALAGGRLYAAHERARLLSVLDPATLGPLGTVPAPGPVALGTDGQRLYAACTGDNTLRAYDPQSGQQTGSSLDLPGVPSALAVSPNCPQLAVLLDGGRFCLVIRAAPQLLGAAVPTGTGSTTRCAALAPDGTKLYVGVSRPGPDGRPAGAVLVYPTGATAPTAPKTTLDAFPPGTLPLAVCPAADGSVLYVSLAGSGPAAGRVQVVDAHRDALLPLTFAPGGDCGVLAASPTGAGYRACLFAAPAAAGSLLVADQTPLGQLPPRPPQLAARQPLGPSGVTDLAWSTAPVGPGRAEPASPSAQATRVTGLVPGLVPVRADYLPGGGLLPYQCEVRLRPDLDARPDVVIDKEQYDLVLNIVNWFHPIGVEVRTDRLRAHVRELSGASADADLLPDYTFPTFHTSDQPPSRFHRPDKDEGP
ncbi:LamG-like jellyroll fold domain-containing protein [Kitasatospora sp. NPDC094028]